MDTSVEGTSEPTVGSNETETVYRMTLGKQDIEKMISDGILDKVSEGYYRVKADSLQDIKLAGKPFPDIMPKTPLASVQKVATSSSGGSQVMPVVIPSLPGNATMGQPPGSCFALMPVDSQTNADAFIAAQKLPNFNPNIPTFFAVAHNAAAAPNTPKVMPASGTNSNIHNVTSPTGLNTSNVQSVSPAASPSSVQPTSKIQTRSSSQLQNSSPQPVPVTAAETVTRINLKRKSMGDDIKGRKPYKYPKPIRGKGRPPKPSKSVSDNNSSDEERETLNDDKSLETQLVSMFFKKFGTKEKKQSQSFLDELHKAIFEENVSGSDTASEDEFEEELNEILSEKKACKLSTCPGPGKIETFVGPCKNSKLTIIRSSETKTIKNFLYEVYKVRVTSLGREANTNILIPVPEQYKFEYPLKIPEQKVEFSHLPHKESVFLSDYNKKFLEELATTKLKLRKYKDEIKVLRRRYLELFQEYANRPQFSTMSDLVGAAARFLSEDQLIFFLMQLKAGAHNMQGIRYSVREKILALAIYQKSSKVYRWFQQLFNLPSKMVLDQWLEDLAHQDPQLLKKVMYHAYTSYNYKPVS